MTETPKQSAKGLGRGLSALLGDYGTDSSANAGTISGPKEIPLDLIRRNPSQPRRSFNEAELDELAASLRAHGVVQPILVRDVAGEPGNYEIVAGERRWRAAQRAGLHAIPAVIKTLDDLAVLEIAIVENVQRVDLDAIEEAVGYKQLIERFGRTQQTIADAVGKSRTHIANLLRLLALPESVQNMVRQGRISAGHARAALSAADPQQFAETVAAKGMSVREAERFASRSANPQRPHLETKSNHGDADTRALEADLTAALGLPVAISHSPAKGGNVTLSYRSLEQLDDLCRRLTMAGR